MIPRTPILSFAGALISVLGGPSHAQTYPAITGELEVEFQNDRAYAVPAGARRTNDLFTKTELGLALFATKELSLQSGFVLEPVRSAERSRAFQDHGLYVEKLFANYENENFSAYLGKFNPGFGIAWDKAPGIYGADFSEDYELTERLGLGGSVKYHGLDLGEHEFGVAVFAADTSALSNSAFTRPRAGEPTTTRPRRLHRANGGSSNTESLRSFSLTLDGGEFRLLPGLSYHVGLARQHPGANGTRHEFGLVGAVQYAWQITKLWTITPLAEYAAVRNVGGADGTHRSYLTAALAVSRGHYSASVSHTKRWVDMPDDAGPDQRDRLTTASFGYAFDFGVEASVGWKRERVDGAHADTFGAQLRYSYRF